MVSSSPLNQLSPCDNPIRNLAIIMEARGFQSNLAKKGVTAVMIAQTVVESSRTLSPPILVKETTAINPTMKDKTFSTTISINIIRQYFYIYILVLFKQIKKKKRFQLIIQSENYHPSLIYVYSVYIYIYIYIYITLFCRLKVQIEITYYKRGTHKHRQMLVPVFQELGGISGITTSRQYGL